MKQVKITDLEICEDGEPRQLTKFDIDSMHK